MSNEYKATPQETASEFLESDWINLAQPSLEARLAKRVAMIRKQREYEIVLYGIADRQVFYYPGAGHDWQPLRRLTHLCDTFVYSDCGATAESVTGTFCVPGLTLDFIVDLTPDTVAYLSNVTGLPPYVRDATVGVAPWAKYAQLSRLVGDVSRKIHFLYLGIEGITAYFNLFSPVQTAPKALCLKLGMGHNAQLFDWEGALGKLVQACRTEPTYLVSYSPGTWPHPTLWQYLRNCGSGSLSIWAKDGHMQEPSVQANPLNGERKVIVQRGTLTPESVAGCEAIVLPLKLYLRHRQQWPPNSKIMLLAPRDQQGQLPAGDERATFIGKRWAPLQSILDSISAQCREHGIKGVSSVGIGYEDEGPALDAWRQEQGPPLEITIYCEHQGDVASFGPYADTTL